MLQHKWPYGRCTIPETRMLFLSAYQSHVLKLAKDPNMLVLTYDVTYWDRVGWKVMFGNPEFDQRQRDYAKALQRQNVFTPQVNNSATLILMVIANCLLGHHQRPD